MNCNELLALIVNANCMSIIFSNTHHLHFPRYSGSATNNHAIKSLDGLFMCLRHLSELVEAPTVAPPPGTTIQSRLHVSPENIFNKV